MKFVLAFVSFLLVAGCASSHRIPPLVDIAALGPMHVVVREHGGPVGTEYVVNNAAVVTPLYQFGFVGGFIAGVILTNMDEDSKKRADIQASDLRVVVTEEMLDEIAPRAITESSGTDNRIGNIVRANHASTDEELLQNDGTTLIIVPELRMSPSFETLRVAIFATAYNSKTGRRIYQSTLRCFDTLNGSKAKQENARIWASLTPPFLVSEAGRCVRSLFELLAIDVFDEWDTLELIPKSEREVSRDRSEGVEIGRFEDYPIIEHEDFGHTLPRVVNAPSEGKGWQMPVLANAEIIERINSDNPADSRLAAQYVLAHRRLSQDILDAVAADLWTNKSETDGLHVDAALWLYEVLVVSANPRYREILSRLMKSAAHKEARQYAKYARWELKDTDVEQYQATAP